MYSQKALSRREAVWSIGEGTPKVFFHVLRQVNQPPFFSQFYFLKRPILEDRKSTRLNSSHANISYAVFCLKKKKDDGKTCLRRASWLRGRTRRGLARTYDPAA